MGEIGTAGAQQFLHLLDCHIDHTGRLVLDLTRELNEGAIGAVNTPRQDRRDVEERGRVLQRGWVHDVELAACQRAHLRCVRAI